LLKAQSLDRNICSTCLLSLRQPQIRHASTTGTVEVASPSSSTLANSTQPSTTTASSPFHLKAGIVLSRPPVITRDLTSFEKAFFFYQKRLNERLALPFTRYFYYQKDTPGDLEWKRKMKQRTSPSRDIGNYNAHKKDSWNDELLVGAKESEPTEHIQALLKDAVVEVEEQIEGQEGVVKRSVEVEKPQSRITEADKQGDTRSLNRALQRTLYLVVKGKDGQWRFPSGEPEGKESLARVCSIFYDHEVKTLIISRLQSDY
jgi:large subunit ribosomal protein L46